MKSEKLRVKNNARGITLIALIITIIVMLILAGVTINLTLGENGIFTTAQKAAKNYTDAQNKEMADLGDFTNLVDETINGLGQEHKVTEITLGKTSTTILEGETETITAYVTPTNATNQKLAWTSSDTNVATVSEGTITAVSVGTATITAAAQDGSEVSASCAVTVTKREVKVTGITLGKTSTTIGVGSTEILTVSISPVDASNQNLTWTSSDESVATVENGTVTALKAGTTTITATAQDASGVNASCTVTVTNPMLTSKITGSDYGKAIDYSVTVKNSSNEDITLSNWRVFYNDKTTNNVYIIYDGYLPNTLIPESTGMIIKGAYQAYWSVDNLTTPYNESAISTLINTENWSTFAMGVKGATAMGAPTNEMFVNSWNENPKVNSKKLTEGAIGSNLTDSSKLYIPFTSQEQGCYGYWLASPVADDAYNVWNVSCSGRVDSSSGRVDSGSFGSKLYGVRPLVCLPSDITGTVGTTVSIDK